MSVKQLKFYGKFNLEVRKLGINSFIFETELCIINDKCQFALDRDQAHLLKLWLEEHLKAAS